MSLLIIIFYVQNQPSQWTSQRGAALLSVSQNRSYRCGKRTRRAKALVKITRPFQPPPAPTPPLPPPFDPDLSFPHPLSAARVHVFLSAVSALCCTNHGRLPKVHATRPRLIIILWRIVDPVRSRERRKRRKTKLAYKFGRLRSGNAEDEYLIVHAIKDNEC